MIILYENIIEQDNPLCDEVTKLEGVFEEKLIQKLKQRN